MPSFDINENEDLASLAEKLEGIKSPDDLKSLSRRQGNGMNPSAPPLSRRTKSLLLGVAISLVLVVAAITVFARRHQPSPITRLVPANLTGQPLAAAKDAISKSGLRPVVRYDATSKKPAGTVLALDPPGGSKVRQGGDIVIKVAGKADACNVPPGKTTAPQPYARVNPTPTPTPQPTPRPNHQDSQVAVTNPPAAQITVPDVEGMVAAKARTMLENVGLKVKEMAARDETQPNSIVLSSEPKPGLLVDSGAEVCLCINALPAQQAPLQQQSAAGNVMLKNYVGMPAQQVARELTALGLTPRYSYETTRLQPVGCVVKTQPPAGAALPPRTPVLVVIAR